MWEVIDRFVTAESSDNDKTYVLPDGSINTVSDERPLEIEVRTGMCKVDSECSLHRELSSAIFFFKFSSRSRN